MKVSITEEEYQILLDYRMRRIDWDERHRLIGYEVSYEELKVILLSLKDKNLEDRYNKFFTIMRFMPSSITEKERAKLYREMLYEDWHGEHERIVADFDRYYQFPENIEAIEYVLFNPPWSAKYSDGVVRDDFIKNCIWAISHQSYPYNIECLQRLAKSENERIKEVAMYHIHRLDPNLPEIDFPYQ